jgi:hypothetical protein
MDGNNIFLIQKNADGSFTNVPFSQAGIGIDGNQITFLSQNISFSSTGLVSGPDQSVSGPTSYIAGNPIVFSGQGQVSFGNQQRSPYISFYNTDPGGNVFEVQKAKRIGSGPFIRRAYNDYLINAKDGDGTPVFAVKHFYSYSLPGQSKEGKGIPYIGIFCNPDDTISSTFTSVPYSVTISGHPTFGAAIRFYQGKNEEGYGATQTNIKYLNNNLYVIRTDNIGNDTIDFQIDNSGYILMNNNPSFGRYSYPVENANNLIGKKTSPNKIRKRLEATNITGMQDTNIINMFDKEDFYYANTPVLANQYIMLPNPVGYNKTHMIVVNSGLYSGKAFKKVKTHPSIGNEYFDLILQSGNNQRIKPYPKYIETFVNIHIPSGKGKVRPLRFIAPSIATVNNPVINWLFLILPKEDLKIHPIQDFAPIVN